MSQKQDYRNTALGLVSVQSFPAIVGIADHMLKASEVTLVGYEKIGAGNCTAVVRGSIADVRLAVSEGAEWAEKFFGQQASTLVVPRPLPNLEEVLPIGHRLKELVARQGRSRLSNLAIGLLETKGFPAMVGAADAMLKASEVVLGGYETIGSGLCTAIIRGSLANVVVAIDAGMAEADRIGELHAVMVVQRPLDDLEQTLPTDSCWIEELHPLRLPVTIKETERELVSLSEAKQEQSRLVLPEIVPEGQPLRIDMEPASPVKVEPRKIQQVPELPVPEHSFNGDTAARELANGKESPKLRWKKQGSD